MHKSSLEPWSQRVSLEGMARKLHLGGTDIPQMRKKKAPAWVEGLSGISWACGEDEDGED